MSNVGILFHNPQKVDLTLLEGSRINLPMFQNDINIFRGVTNRIKYEIRNADRKPVRMLNNDILVVITNPQNGELMLKKYCNIIDERKGIFELVLTPGDIQGWSQGFYTYSVVYIDMDGEEQLLYTDLSQNAIGKFNLQDRPLPVFVPGVLVEPEGFLAHNGGFVTERYPGDAQKNFQDSLQTISVKVTNFTGRLYLQGSLEDYPNQDNEFFDIHIGDTTPYIDYVNATGVFSYNFIGSFVWIRFFKTVDMANTGTLDKIWYRN